MSVIYINSYQFATPAGATDPYFSNVSLLLHGDGTNGSTTITDSSPSPKTVTAFGNAQISTAQSKFGGASIAFDGNGDYLTAPNDASFILSNADFTIEAWINTADPSTTQAIVAKETSNKNAYLLHVAGNRLRIALSSNGSSYSVNAPGTIPLIANTWHHIAITRNGSGPNNIKSFVDGSQDVQATFSDSIYNDTSLFTVGYRAAASALFFNGYIDDLRITKGIARYTSNFTPPTAPFPDA